MLPKMGYLGYMLLQNDFSYEEVQELELKVRFVGVYDTVSSYYKEKSLIKFFYDQQTGDPRINKYFADDMSELNLKNFGAIQKAVHFTAKDEHRYNFALSTFKGATEKEFPGVHCDIGGAYLNEPEIVDEIEVAFTPSGNIAKHALQKTAYLLKKGFWGDEANLNLNNYKAELIEESWFKDFQININDINTIKYKGKNKILPKALNSVYDKLSGNRILRKEYSFIPLLFMEEYFSNTLDTKLLTVMPLRDQLLTTYSVDSFPILVKAKDYLKPYVMDDIGNSWIYNAKEHFKIKEEISEKKKQRLLENAEKESKKSKREYKHPVSKQDDDLASQNRKDQAKLNPFKQNLTNDNDIMQDINDEKEIKLKSAQGVLELLRNEYFHWSANKDWVGMNPTESRARTTIH